jgi:NADH:quinone reductase (non-electrogenic)
MSESRTTNRDRPTVVIVGGGFGGLAAAHALRGAPVRVVIVDRRNHHLFQPLLYQVATAALSPEDIAMPIRRVFRRQSNVEVFMGEAERIDRAARKVILSDGELAYDYLVVATGATHSYFGHDEWASYAPGLKRVEDAIAIRRRMLLAYEAAEREPDPARQRDWMTFVVIGAGPTGVEMAGSLAEIARRVLERDFRRIETSRTRVVLIEASDRVLPAMSPESSQSARRQLEHLGVEVITGRAVSEVDGAGVRAGEDRIDARTVIWAAGVAASPLGRTLGAEVDRAGRVGVALDLSLPGSPEVYVIGDLASIKCDGKPVPGLAPAAMQEGRHAAASIVRMLRGEPTAPFRYRDKGMLATIGRAAAVAEYGGLRLSGFAAWLLWLFVHIFYLIGFRNRFVVISEWAWVYLRNERGARLITGDLGQPLVRDCE